MVIKVSNYVRKNSTAESGNVSRTFWSIGNDITPGRRSHTVLFNTKVKSDEWTFSFCNAIFREYYVRVLSIDKCFCETKSFICSFPSSLNMYKTLKNYLLLINKIRFFSPIFFFVTSAIKFLLVYNFKMKVSRPFVWSFKHYNKIILYCSYNPVEKSCIY